MVFVYVYGICGCVRNTCALMFVCVCVLVNLACWYVKVWCVKGVVCEGCGVRRVWRVKVVVCEGCGVKFVVCEGCDA